MGAPLYNIRCWSVLALAAAVCISASNSTFAAEKDIDKVIPRKKMTPAPKVKKANPVKRARPRARPMPRVRSSIMREIIRKAKARARMGDTCRRVGKTRYTGIRWLAPIARLMQVYLVNWNFAGGCSVYIFTRKSKHLAKNNENFCLYYIEYSCSNLLNSCSINFFQRVCKHRKDLGWSRHDDTLGRKEHCSRCRPTRTCPSRCPRARP